MKKYSSFVPMADVTGLNAKGRETVGWDWDQRSLPEKLPSRFNINIANRSLAGNFNYDDLIKPLTQSQSLPQHYTLGQYIQKFPPVPAGVSYRTIKPRPYGSNSVYDTINDYTNLLNTSGIYPENLSYPSVINYPYLNSSFGPRNKSEIYHTDSRDVANWLWNRRGLLLTDDLWNRAIKSRLSANSQLNTMPLSMYFAWSSDNDDVNAYSMRLGNDEGFNLFMHVFNPSYFDNTYRQSEYSGYGSELNDGLLLDPWERLMDFLDAQDHELSHSFNNIWKPGDWIGDSINDDRFFRTSNDPENPYYDDDTTNQRRDKYSNMFKNTYLEIPGEYIGAMGRVKRYGAELGFDTTSIDPDKARLAMALTLHYFATHQNPLELTSELQRIHSWLNTAAADHMLEYSLDYKHRRIYELLRGPANSEEELKQRAIQSLLHRLNFNTDKDNYIKDVQSPFYSDVLDFMTDDTIQGLVHQSPNLKSLSRLT